MSDSLPADVVRYAGLVMTQAASIASIMGEGELICPFIVVTKGEVRQSIAFEANTQDEAVSRGWASLDEYRTCIDLWAFAREGLISDSNGKEDVLVVAVWKPGMKEPAIFLQRFLSAENGGFALVGPVVAEGQPSTDLSGIAESFMEGVRNHPKGQELVRTQQRPIQDHQDPVS